MFGFLHRKISAARTLAALCQAAEAEARRDGQAEPGTEHFVLAALSMPDGQAARVFSSLGLTDADLRGAIARQYQGPLLALGLKTPVAVAPLPAAHKAGVYRAAPSGQALVQALASNCRASLASHHVLAAAAEQRERVFARPLAVMGVQPDQLRRAVLST